MWGAEDETEFRGSSVSVLMALDDNRRTYELCVNCVPIPARSSLRVLVLGLSLRVKVIKADWFVEWPLLAVDWRDPTLGAVLQLSRLVLDKRPDMLAWMGGCFVWREKCLVEEWGCDSEGDERYLAVNMTGRAPTGNS